MWNCPKCNEEVEDQFDVCWNCQTERPEQQHANVKGAQKTTQTSSGPEPVRRSKQEHTYDPKEKVLGVVGQKFLTSLIVGMGFTQTSLMVTDKRLYAAGTNYSTKGKAYQTLVGEVKALHSIGIEYSSNFWLLVFGIPLLAAYGLGVILIIMYFWTRQRNIQFNFGGEVTSLSLRGISNEEVERFIKTVMLAKGDH